MDWLKSQLGDRVFEFIRKSTERAEDSAEQVLILENQAEIEDSILDLLELEKFTDGRNYLSNYPRASQCLFACCPNSLDTLVVGGRIVKRSNLYSSANVDPDIYWSLKSTEFTFDYGIIL